MNQLRFYGLLQFRDFVLGHEICALCLWACEHEI